MLLGGLLTHFRRSMPIYNCNPIKANTDSTNEVNIITSRNRKTD